MKVGILTITDGANYGNRLQNYAMQEFLRSINKEVETIQRSTPRDMHGLIRLKYIIKEYIKKAVGKTNTNFYLRKRKLRFQEFNRKFINFSKVCLSNNQAPKDLKKKYDYFICGSDQIWNTCFEVVLCDIKNHLASFANTSQRIAFAASFGTNSIAPEYKEIFKSELKKFKAIAVREDSGKQIVDELTNTTDSVVVLDPTLLLNKQQWLRIEKEPAFIKNEKFLITYFLGGRNSNLNNYINHFASVNKLQIINLDIEFLTDDRIENKSFFLTTPDEFVWLIHHAEYVLTDSFHGMVFCILFHKQFAVFANSKRGLTRFTSLLGMLGLTERMTTVFGKEEVLNILKQPVDYVSVESLLATHRKKSLGFLENNL